MRRAVRDGVAEITMFGATWCTDCKRSKQFFGEQRVPYDFIDIEADPSAITRMHELNGGRDSIPTIRFADGAVLVEPSNVELAQKLGLQTVARRNFYDLIIIGSGPAGLTAALYAAREGIDTLVIERAGVGGQAGVTERLDNFPGFPEGVTGAEFAMRLRQQAERFGVEILQAQDVQQVFVDGEYRGVRLSDGHECRSWAVLLAAGSTYRRLGIPGEQDFIGAGVHFCATCDGPFYRGGDVLVVGGGNSAGEEGLFLTKFARHVTIATRGPELTASRIVAEKVRQTPSVSVLTNVAPSAFSGDKRLRAVTLQDTRSGETHELQPDGVFVFIGLQPNTAFVRGLVELDGMGFITTDVGLQTSQSGVFAAGDCRAGSTKQAASAAGEGAAAALAIRRYLEPRAGGMVTSNTVEAMA
jgi:thioredoxin reductase (NADPH)